jgi:hypothetical protein
MGSYTEAVCRGAAEAIKWFDHALFQRLEARDEELGEDPGCVGLCCPGDATPTVEGDEHAYEQSDDIMKLRIPVPNLHAAEEVGVLDIFDDGATEV